MMTRKHLPDFLCVGAPKCGTTSLYDYLRQHPNIYLPSQKELHFFSNKDLFGLTQGPASKHSKTDWIRTLDEYTNIYNMAKEDQLCGDISPSYLYAHTAPYQIAETLEDPKIIICLRNPVERAYSQYMHLVREARESKSFLEALSLEKARVSSGWDAIFHCAGMSLYTDSVKRYLTTFGTERLLIIWFDDLKNDIRRSLWTICQFLDIDDSFCFTSVPNRNISGPPKSRLLALMFRAGPILSLAKKVLPRDLGRAVKSTVHQLNTDKSIKITPEERSAAMKYFKDDIRNLESLLGVKTGWLRT